MKKSTSVKHLQALVDDYQKRLDAVKALEPGKTYMVHFGGSMKWGKNHSATKTHHVILGSVDHYNQDSVSFSPLGCTTIVDGYMSSTGSVDAYNNLTNMTIKHDEFLSIEEWKNAETPELEAPFLVNWDWLHQDLKKLVFGY